MSQNILDSLERKPISAQEDLGPVQHPTLQKNNKACLCSVFRHFITLYRISLDEVRALNVPGISSARAIEENSAAQNTLKHG